MRRHRNKIDIDTLRRFLDYDPSKGTFTWRERSEDCFKTPDSSSIRGRRDIMAKVWNTKWAGKPAFTTLRCGYVVSPVKGTHLYGHRAAWAHYYGEWPPDEMEVDHVNGDRADNRIENLRLVTPAENSKNKRLQKINTSGCSGVMWATSRERWEASISDSGKHIHLGSYHTKEEAVAARRAAEKVLGYHEKHGRADRPAYDDPPRPNRTRAKT